MDLVVCEEYLKKGFCSKGKKCLYADSHKKCVYFMQGSCPFKEKCCFYHHPKKFGIC